jgi:NADPH2 dehydrogenase
MSALFSPIEIRNLKLANRIVISPMCQYSADNGAATDWHMMHLGSMAMSGAGLMVIEATAVEPEGRITPADLGLWDDRTEAALRPVNAAIRKHTPVKIAMQIAHAGRKASSQLPWEGGQLILPEHGGWRPCAPSALPQKDGEAAPLELDHAGLERIKAAFVATARRADALGLDAIEIHNAHGYLLHEFLSPISNQRTDEYGGALENRMRFPLEVFEAVRTAFPADKPVGVRVSATDWVDGGWDIEQTIVFAKELKARGVDWIDASSGGVSPAQKIPTGPGYQVHLAQAIKAATGVTTFAVGLIDDAEQAETIIASGQADLVALARGALYDPRWAWHAAARLGGQVSAPPQYWRSIPHGVKKDLFGETTGGSR